MLGLWLGWTLLAFGGPFGGACGDAEAVGEAAHGGWLLTSERQCLHQRAAHGRVERRVWASKLLLADAQARGDRWTWTTLAERHLELDPEDVDLWLALVHERWVRGDSAEVERLANEALGADWVLPPGDPRVVQLHRYRTYAAVRSRARVDEDVERYAREWRAVQHAPAPHVVGFADGFRHAPTVLPSE